MAGAHILGLPFSIGAFFSDGLATAAMLFLNQRTKLREDAITGLTFSSLFALGLFVVSLRLSAVNIQITVLGSRMLGKAALNPASGEEHLDPPEELKLLFDATSGADLIRKRLCQ